MKKLFVCTVLILSASFAAFSQKRATAKPGAKSKPIVFAVLNDGQTLEPIGEVDKGKLVATANGGDDAKVLTSFANKYYKPKTVYNLIFGGAANGTVTVDSYDAKSDCGKNLAQVSTKSAKARLKGFVMGLATSETTAKTALGTRRLPTNAERSEIESLVRVEFAKQGISPNAVKNLKYYNLTALDVDKDGKAEMVGSFWVKTSAKERNLLFFIAGKDDGDKYNFGYSDYKKVTPDEIMNGELRALDGGIGNELLLDAMDYNGDATAEIFTVSKSLEGNNFQVYSRQNGKWTKVFEGYNYHCAY